MVPHALSIHTKFTSQLDSSKNTCQSRVFYQSQVQWMLKVA